MLQDRAWAVPLLLAVAVLLNCGGGGGRVDAGTHSVEVDSSQGLRQKDEDNRYPSVVLIKSELGFCSGVLVAPRLVLTAAHCFCPPGGGMDGKGGGANCGKRAMAVSYLYERVGDALRPTLDTSEGTVVVNAEFRVETQRVGDRTLVKNRVADLAVVRLEKPLGNARVDGKLRRKEVLLKDELTLVGYGATDATGSNGGERRSGRNRVSDLRSSSNREGHEIGFRLPGAHARPGDSGAPCFLEEDGVRWLVGISSGYATQGFAESWFTSTSSYRDWIEGQIEEARKLESP